MVNGFIGTLEFAKVLMTVFVMFYAYYFLKRTKEDEEKRSWEYLYIAAMFLFLVEVASSLQLFRGTAETAIVLGNIQGFLEFGFLAFFLYSFIYQHNLLLKEKNLLLEERDTKTFFDNLKSKFFKYEKTTKQVLKDEGEGIDPEDELKEELAKINLEESEELKKIIK